MRKIESICVEEIGRISSIDGEIDEDNTTGKLWYIQGNKEFNGKYVIAVDYGKDSNE